MGNQSANPEQKYFCKCKICDTKFKYRATGASHVEATHEGGGHICDICSRVFKVKQENYKIGKEKLPTTNYLETFQRRLHPCHQCSKEIKWVPALKQHEGLVFSCSLDKNKQALHTHQGNQTNDQIDGVCQFPILFENLPYKFCILLMESARDHTADSMETEAYLKHSLESIHYNPCSNMVLAALSISNGSSKEDPEKDYDEKPPDIRKSNFQIHGTRQQDDIYRC